MTARRNARRELLACLVLVIVAVLLIGIETGWR